MIHLTAALHHFSRCTGVPAGDILGSSRRAEIVAARHLYWLILRDKMGITYIGIADFCGVNHNTVVHGVNAVRDKLDIGDKLVCDLWELVEDIDV